GALVAAVGRLVDGATGRTVRRCDQEIPLIAITIRRGLVGATRRGLARTIRRGLVDAVARVIGALRQRAEIGLRLLRQRVTDHRQGIPDRRRRLVVLVGLVHHGCGALVDPGEQRGGGSGGRGGHQPRQRRERRR